MSHDVQVMEKEMEMLRDELQGLKECQIRYFWSAVTLTGILFGIGARWGADGNSWAMYLAPLVIILPCWLVFFDKATTITRIVGYLRLLEFLRRRPHATEYAYLGWENALALFRGDQRARDARFKRLRRFWSCVKHAMQATMFLLEFRRWHRYWLINWLTFFGLGVLCCVVGWVSYRTGVASIHNGFAVGVLWAASVVSALVAIYNMHILHQLTVRDGEYSYDANEQRWKMLLSSPEARAYLDQRFSVAGGERPHA